MTGDGAAGVGSIVGAGPVGVTVGVGPSGAVLGSAARPASGAAVDEDADAMSSTIWAMSGEIGSRSAGAGAGDGVADGGVARKVASSARTMSLLGAGSP